MRLEEEGGEPWVEQPHGGISSSAWRGGRRCFPENGVPHQPHQALVSFERGWVAVPRSGSNEIEKIPECGGLVPGSLLPPRMCSSAPELAGKPETKAERERAEPRGEKG